MREIVIRPRAYADLEGIWLYTNERWDAGQADRYTRQLSERVLALAEAPEHGRNREAIRPGYYSVHVGRHFIFDTVTEKVVGIERVLHDQMDVDRHL